MRDLANRLAAAAFAVAVVSAVITPMLAQESRGTIVGRITDPSGAAIVGAQVEVISKAQGVKQSLRSNESGQYQAVYLIPGQYQVLATSDGFKRAVREAVEIQVGDRVAVDLVMEVGSASESITVSAQGALLDTASASMGQVIDTKRIAELPIAHGQPFSLIGLSAGVAFTGSQTLDRPYEPTHIAGFAVNGTYGNRSDITIDGIPSTSTANANEVTASYVPPQDIVQEFRVQTATFDSQFGNTEGAVTNISIKSGTNDFHGTAYYYKQAPELFANNWFANANRQPRSDFNYDRWGGSFSGPIRIPKVYDGRNRTFFMYGPEGFKDNRPRNNGNFTTLTDANKTGDFSSLLNVGSQYQIFDPLTRRETAPGSGIFTADPFPNNIIPANRINPVTRALLTYWPSPTSPGQAAPDGTNNFQQPNILEKTDYFNHTLRLDHNFTQSQRMFFRWSSYDRDSNYNNYFNNLATGENFQFVSRSASLDYVKVLNASMVLNFRYGYNRFIRIIANNPESEGFDITTLGFSPSYASQVLEGSRQFPRIDISGYQGTGIGGEYRPNDTHSFMSTLVQSAGKHALKYGYEFRSYRENAVFDGNDTLGRFEFNSDYTRGPLSTTATSPNNIGQSAAAFLLGLPTRFSVIRQSQYSEQSTTHGIFVQDDWRVTDRLTLNLGLRYEFEGALSERWGRSLAGFDPTLPVTSPGGATFQGALLTGEPGGGLYDAPRRNFMPRFGFAYKLNDLTVLRGGYGIFYGFLGQRRGDVIRNGFSRTTEYPATLDNLNFANNLSNAFTTPILEPLSPAQVPGTLLGTSTGFFNQEPLSPQNQRWQLSFQRQLPGSIVLEAAYVGNRGTRMEITRDINAIPLQYLSTTGVRDNTTINFLNAQIPNPYRGQLPGTNLNNATIQRAQSLRPFPYYQDLTTTTNQGYTWYHSLQVSAEKRFSQNYTVQMSYTWSKFMEAIGYLNPADPMPAEVISGADRPHRLVVSGIYELPFGAGRTFLNSTNGIVSRLVGGWQLNGIVTFQSGSPLSFGNVLFTGNFADLALDNPTPERWFNIDAGFNRVANQALERNVRTFPFRTTYLRGDNINNVDFSIIKNTRFSERLNVQIRAEALNAFNTPQFANPSADNLNPVNANFGRVTGQENYARRIQLGIRAVF